MKFHRKMLFINLLVVLIGMTACNSSGQQVENIISIHHGSSFGMCEGYCINEVIYSSDNRIELRKKWNNEDSICDTTAFSTYELEEMLDLINLDDFFKLKKVYGCPDCADGGSEWIEIKTKSKNKKVTFEYGKNEIPVIEELVNKLRELNK